MNNINLHHREIPTHKGAPSMPKDDAITRLTTILEQNLNRPVTESLTHSLVNFYLKTTSQSAFLVYTKALGFPSSENGDGLGKQAYNYINDNIDAIDKVMKNDGISTNLSISKRTDSNEPKRSAKPAKKPKLSLDYLEETSETTPSAPVAALGSDTFLDDLPDTRPPSRPAKFKFKTIKKEDALRIKEEPLADAWERSTTIASPAEPETKSAIKSEPLPSLADLAKMDKLLSLSVYNTIKEEDAQLGYELLLDQAAGPQNIDLDRDWYMSEDFGAQALTDQYEDLEAPSYPSLSAKSRAFKSTRSDDRNGAGFDKNGEYVDFDHEQSNDTNDFSRISLASHFFVPPFLESARDSLSLLVGSNLKTDNFISAIGPSVEVVKDSTSELALSSKNGSLVVKDRKTKRERSKQAKDRSKLEGTALGNVLGVEDEPLEEHHNDGPNEEPTAESHLSIQQQRRSLPAYAVKNDLMRTLLENQITIVVGETGSGKTTQLAQFLYEEGFGSNISKDGRRKMIGCTQPRRMAAMSVAKRVSEEMNCVLGEEVGYSIRFEDRTSHKKTIVKYMTDGVLLREILVDPTLENYSCVIMDEAHERSLNTDILLGLFKVLLSKRKDLKLIVTSATMNADRFSSFFGNAPQFIIPGRTFPVDIMFSKTSCSDYVETAVKQVLTIHLANSARTKSSDGDILVFMTGQEDIEVTCELLKEKLDLLDDPPPLDVYPVYSTLPADLQKKIFNKLSSSRRKVVVATNIAETSLTVDGIKYVIDTGLIKMKMFNPKLGMDMLQVVPVSLANANQRSGRAGRTGPGVAYRLYTERATDIKQMYAQPIPEIQRTNLSNILLLLKSLKVDDIKTFPFLDSPPVDLLNYSLYNLWSIGAVDDLGDMTDLGRAMTSFPIDPTLSKLIIIANKPQFQCSDEILSIISMLSVPSVFFRPKERAREADLAREKFLVFESDHLTLLNVYLQFETQLKKGQSNYRRISQWCTKNFLHLKSLLRARDIRNQLLLIMKKKGLSVVRLEKDDDIRKCLCAAYYQQLAKLVKISISGNDQAEYTNLRYNFMKMYIHPTSALNGGTNMAPSYVVYHELVLTSKEYINCVTAVDPLWLLEFGYMFYEVSSATRQKIESALDFRLVGTEEFRLRLDASKVAFDKKVAAKAPKRAEKTADGKVRTQFNKRRAL